MSITDGANPLAVFKEIKKYLRVDLTYVQTLKNLQACKLWRKFNASTDY